MGPWRNKGYMSLSDPFILVCRLSVERTAKCETFTLHTLEQVYTLADGHIPAPPISII